jgi:hypothetical protein
MIDALGAHLSRVHGRIRGLPLGAEISGISPFLEAESFSTTVEIDVEVQQGLWMRNRVFSSGGGNAVEIERVDGQGIIYVSATWESDVALGDAVDRIRAEFENLVLPERFALVFGCQYEGQKAARRDFTVAVVTALAVVYMLMAAQFERFLDPLKPHFGNSLLFAGCCVMMPKRPRAGTSCHIVGRLVTRRVLRWPERQSPPAVLPFTTQPETTRSAPATLCRAPAGRISVF